MGASVPEGLTNPGALITLCQCGRKRSLPSSNWQEFEGVGFVKRGGTQKLRCEKCGEIEGSFSVVGLGHFCCDWCLNFTGISKRGQISRCTFCHVYKDLEDLAFSFYNYYFICEECYSWCIAYGIK